MSKLTARCYVLFTLMISFCAQAQEFSFVNVNHRIALPSLECYNILQDDKGTIWIGTEQGLLCYNGSSTKVFDQKNGLPEKAIYASMSYQGKLWFATSKNRIMNYSDGKLREAAASTVYQKQLGKPYTQNLTYALSVQENQIYLFGGQSLHRMDTVGTKTEELHAPEDNSIYLKQTPDGLLPLNGTLIHSYEALSKKMFSVPLELNINGLNGNKVFYPAIRRHNNGSEWRILTTQTKKYIFMSFHSRVIKFDRELSTFEIFHLPTPVISLYADPDGGLWIGTIRQGLYYYNFTEQKTSPVVSLRNSSVSGVIQDREGNIWCTTLEDGVFILRSKQVVGYQNLSGQSVAPTMLQTIDDKLWISTPGYGLQYFDTSTNRFVKVDKTSARSYYHVWKQDKKLFLSSEAGVLKYHPDGNKSLGEKYGSILSLIVMGSVLAPSGDFYTITYDRIFHTAARTHNRNMVAHLSTMGRTIQYVNKDTLLYGCIDGLYLYDIKNAKSTKMYGIYNDVPNILRARDGKLWICTSGSGLFTYAKGKLLRIKFPLKIQTNTFNGITQDDYGNIWIGTNAGLVKIWEKNGQMQSEIYGLDNGLPSSKVFRVATAGDRLFFTTHGGLFSIPLSNSLKNKVPPLLSLSAISSQGRPISGQIELPYDNNRLELEFNVGQYGNDNYKIGYTLHPGRPITYVKSNTISLQHLGTGNYQLRAFAINGDGLKSAATVSLDFSVSQPFWLKWWFLAAIFLLVTLTIWLIKNWQVERIRKRQTEWVRINALIADSKLTALQARMNPHFIFNAINSIQNYIYRNKPDDAHDYLTKFSRLIRLILQQSAERFITLDRELEALQLYIELEQLRFRSSFSYHLELDHKVDAQRIYIPSMLVQPYVENAIWHGLMNLNGARNGELSIEITSQAQTLIIRITDNGIGRVKAAELRKSKHYVPAGMMLTEDRLKMLKEIYADLNFGVTITDYYEASGMASGTSVEIILSIATPQMID